ncbi:vignain-like [Ananas comosus]|uniref:Vignain-like n=1 Tax=Ananas comosus TaxID=4615 RepID=A0A6P5FC93_ANACO|nr:vignain-like [Ananas comosus]
MHQIRTGELVDLSVQQVVDCSARPNMRGAFKCVLKNGGIATASTYPYVGNRGECDTRRAARIAASIDGYSVVMWSDESALMRKVANGPVACGISCTPEFDAYAGGVLKASAPNTLDHAVLVVGYGTDRDEGDYWIIKNSWGTGWGENGYARIQRGVPFVGGPFGLAQLIMFPYLRRPSSETVCSTSTGSSKKRKRDTKFKE